MGCCWPSHIFRCLIVAFGMLVLYNQPILLSSTFTAGGFAVEHIGRHAVAAGLGYCERGEINLLIRLRGDRSKTNHL